MVFEEYQRLASLTRNALGTSFEDQLHMVLGIVTEAGELADSYKKSFAYGKELDLVNISEELGDLMWYIANLLEILGLNFSAILEANIDKLRQRYPAGTFSSENAIHRNTDLERRVLEHDYRNRIAQQTSEEKV
jgi:NTP pyrophosphatase (non-canonical NTP hydrolase)